MARAPIIPREDREVFVVPLDIRPDQIDANGHVNNVVYVGWLQDAGTSHWNARFDAATRAKWSWVALRHEIDYLRALGPGETVTARTWVADKPQGAKFDRFMEFTGADGKVHVRARTVWALLDKASGRPLRVTAEVVAPFVD